MIATQNKTHLLYAYQNGVGANTETTLNRTLRHILYGDKYILPPSGKLTQEDGASYLLLESGDFILLEQ